VPTPAISNFNSKKASKEAPERLHFGSPLNGMAVISGGVVAGAGFASSFFSLLFRPQTSAPDEL